MTAADWHRFCRQLVRACRPVLPGLLLSASLVVGQSAGTPAHHAKAKSKAPAASASGKTGKSHARSAEGDEAAPKAKAKSRKGAKAPAAEEDAAPAAKPAHGKLKGKGKAAAAGGDDAAAPNTARGKAAKGKRGRKPSTAAERAADRSRTAKIRQAFTASTELRPMAQQLAGMRTPAAYAGVTAWAHRHTGEAAGAAYLALGHAYLADHRYDEAISNLRQAREADGELADYVDYMLAQALRQSSQPQAAEQILHGFATRYPDSIFNAELPELEARTLLDMKDLATARQVLNAAGGSESASRPGFLLVAAQVNQALGNGEAAIGGYKRLLLIHPLSSEAESARTQLAALGVSLTVAEARSVGDAYYHGGRWALAAEQYEMLGRQPGLDEASRQGFAIAHAACMLKLKRLTQAEAEALPATSDDNGARRLYLMMELARSHDDQAAQSQLVEQMKTQFPRSQWLAEALDSSGKMYLLKRDYQRSADYFVELAARFPNVKYASADHWRAGWMNYRAGNYDNAARLFDEQIRLFPQASETVAALYWRARLNEMIDHRPDLAAPRYRAIIRAYPQFFYALMARERLRMLGNPQAENTSAEAELAPLAARPVPQLTESFPENSPHLAKARLLANAGLGEYIGREISADPDSSTWSALAEAQIYASYGETFRALRSMKRAVPAATSASIASIPLAYWRILYPEPWWATIKEESEKKNLDPYFVASLIRQESEFNPGAISHANAYGLMQLLPSVGREMAREEGLGHFEVNQLLDPVVNIKLGTRYLSKLINHFDGVAEYTLAAYNAGAERVADWRANGPYHGIDEFVESIPFTETREYVQAILRNQATYRAIDLYAAGKGAGTSSR